MLSAAETAFLLQLQQSISGLFGCVVIAFICYGRIWAINSASYQYSNTYRCSPVCLCVRNVIFLVSSDAVLVFDIHMYNFVPFTIRQRLQPRNRHLSTIILFCAVFLSIVTATLDLSAQTSILRILMYHSWDAKRLERVSRKPELLDIRLLKPNTVGVWALVSQVRVQRILPLDCVEPRSTLI
jgi:hypothetical protein